MVVSVRAGACEVEGIYMLRIMHASREKKAALGLLCIALGDYSNTVVADDGDQEKTMQHSYRCRKVNNLFVLLDVNTNII